MFEYIKGKLVQLTPTTAVVDVAGVGWFVNISVQTSSQLEKSGIDSEVKLLLHQYMVQDQSPVLYGFFSDDEREIFRLLISVNGIGASIARIMLSTYTAPQLSKLITLGNTRAIQKTKGVGQKTAERVILELKGKVRIYDEGGEKSSVGGVISATESEATKALSVLGFSESVAAKVVHKLYEENKSISVEDLIRKSLSQM